MSDPTSALTVLFGVGRMGSAMAQGWLQSNICKPLALIEPNPSETVLALAQADGIELNPAPRPALQLVLAIKPQAFPQLRDEIARWCHTDTWLVSIMAGIGMTSLQNALGVSRIVRVMPNLPSALGLGISVWCRSKETGNDSNFITRLLSPLGAEAGPVAEQDMDAMTALSGCGPAYLFSLASAMNKAACALGLKEKEAAQLTRHTLHGAASMLLTPDADAEDLVRQVASSGGATEAALNILAKDQALEQLMETAMRAARDRSIALSAD